MPTPPGQGSLFAAPQGELFARDGEGCDGRGELASQVEVPDEFIEGVRAELNAMLALVRDAVTLPWADADQALRAELRMNSMSRWLPTAEATALVEAFERELHRLD